MTAQGSNNSTAVPPVPGGLDPKMVAAATSKLVAARIGDIAFVFCRSPAHKFFSFADMEWLVLPPVVHSQYYISELVDPQTGAHAPVAVATWAFVSEEVDLRLRQNLSQHIRLRPDEWKCGEIAWIVDFAGDPRGVAHAAQWLLAGPFKDRAAKIVVRDAQGQPRLETLDRLAPSAVAGAP